VQDAGLVVLAAPMRALIALVKEAGDIMRPGAMLLDLGSVKQPVVAAMDRLPEHIGAVAGHPMCGREVAGLAHADGALYQNARFVLCRTARTTENAWVVGEELVEAVGAVGLR
jgi:prephenate dehydrogenase